MRFCDAGLLGVDQWATIRANRDGSTSVQVPAWITHGVWVLTTHPHEVHFLIVINHHSRVPTAREEARDVSVELDESYATSVPNYATSNWGTNLLRTSVIRMNHDHRHWPATRDVRDFAVRVGVTFVSDWEVLDAQNAIRRRHAAGHWHHRDWARLKQPLRLVLDRRPCVLRAFAVLQAHLYRQALGAFSQLCCSQTRFGRVSQPAW